MSENQEPVRESGHLLHNLVLFGRLLRALGIDVNPGRMIDLVQALQYVEIGRQQDFYYTVRSLLVHERDDLALFDEAFKLFWRRPREQGQVWEVEGPRAERDTAVPLLTVPQRHDDEPAVAPGPEGAQEEDPLFLEVTRTYSEREALRRKDFSQMTPDEIEMVKQFMAQMVWQLGQRRTRRQRMGRGRRLDLRRGLRHNLRYGGEILEWPTRRPKIKPRPLVIIADVSGSMERYTKLLLHFIYSVTSTLEQPVEAFVFATRLTRITRQLRHKSVERALAQVSSSVVDWSGGTRIGDALKTFNYDWARRVLGHGAVVLLISDGWDRGDPALLEQEIRRLQRSCHRLIWLNPLLGSPRYEPLTRGMQAALPHIDDFLPVHNLVSLEELADHLSQLTAQKRPLRKRPRPAGGAAFVGRR